MIQEKFETSHKDPSTLLWANGTTDKRFDINGNKFYLRNTQQKQYNDIDIFDPLFLTHNIPLVFNYVSSHISRDYEVTSGTSKHFNHQHNNGVIVFVTLKDGIRLFDFTDVSDYREVFGNDAELIFPIFKKAEPYFSFNSNIPNMKKSLEPIEFSIAKYLAVFLLSSKNKYKNGDPSNPNISFFKSKDNTFSQLFKNINDENLFDNISIDAKIYQNFLTFYNQIYSDATYTTSRTGREQMWKDDTLLKIFPTKINNDQLNKINGYFKLLKHCIIAKSLISDEYADKIDDVIENTDTQKNVGFIDILQICLYAILKINDFNGFYCPEFIGAKNKKILTDAPTIALFSSNVINTITSYNFGLVHDAFNHYKLDSINNISDCNDIIKFLKNITNYKREQEEKKKQAEEQRKKEEEEKQNRIKNGEYFVDDNYTKQVKNILSSKYTNYDYDDCMIMYRNNFLKKYKNKFTKSSPMHVVIALIKQQLSTNINSSYKILNQNSLSDYQFKIYSKKIVNDLSTLLDIETDKNEIEKIHNIFTKVLQKIITISEYLYKQNAYKFNRSFKDQLQQLKSGGFGYRPFKNLTLT